MAVGNLRLEVILSAIDKATKPIKAVLAGSQGLAKQLKETKDRLKELNQAQAGVAAFRQLTRDAKETGDKLAAARQKLKQMQEQMTALGPPTDAMARKLKSAEIAVEKLTVANRKKIDAVKDARAALEANGVSVARLGQHERELASQIATATREMNRQQSALDRVAQRQKKLTAIKQSFQQDRNAAMVTTATGVGALYATKKTLAPGLDESKKFQTEEARIAALGLGSSATQDAIKYAKAMDTYGTSTRDNLTLMRDAMTVFADEHHAQMVTPMLTKMKFANEAMFGGEHGADNERKFMDMLKVIELRGGLSSEKAFRQQANIVQQVITATGGRVDGSEWLNVIKTGGLAAKGMDEKSFYYQLEPLVQEMGGHRTGTALMSAYQNLYQGKTTKRSAQMLDDLGLIGDKSKVKNDKSGQLSYLNPGALKGADLFRKSQFEWMEKVLLPTLASKGITTKDKVLDAIGGIFSNRTASNLFSQMYLQREQIHKNAKLNAGADNIDKLYDKAKNTGAGAELELTAQRANLYKQMGDTVMPAYTRALELAAGAMKGLNGWMEANPTAAKVVVGGIAAIAIALGLIATVLGPLIMLKFALVTLGSLAASAGGALGLLSGGFGLLVKSISLVGNVMMWLGRVFLMNSIGLVVTAIAGAAYLIWSNWDWIGPKFAALWDGIKNAAGFAWDWIKEKATLAGQLLSNFFMNWTLPGLIFKHWDSIIAFIGALPSKFMEFGSQIMQGLASGVSSGLAAVKSAITGAGEAAIGWFKEKLGIHSPSRVFAELGGYTMDGLHQGITDNQGGPLSAVSGMAKKLAAAGAGLSLATGGAMAGGVPIDTRAPISAQRAAPVASAAPQFNITIHAAAGMNEQQLAQLVAREVERVQRQADVSRRSRLTDRD